MSSFIHRDQNRSPSRSPAYTAAATTTPLSLSRTAPSCSPGAASRPRYLSYRKSLSRSLVSTHESRVKLSTASTRDVHDSETACKALATASDLIYPPCHRLDSQGFIAQTLVPSKDASVEVPPHIGRNILDNLAHDIKCELKHSSSSIEDDIHKTISSSQTTQTTMSQSRYQTYRSSLAKGSMGVSRSMGTKKESFTIAQPIATAPDLSAAVSKSIGVMAAKTANEYPRSIDTPIPYDEPAIDYVDEADETVVATVSQDSMMPSLSAVDQSGTNYLRYRQTIFRRVSQIHTLLTTDSDDTCESDVEERLSSYLRRGLSPAMVSAAAISEVGDENRSKKAVDQCVNDPLKSQRAANAPTVAREADGQCSERDSIESVPVMRSRDRDLESAFEDPNDPTLSSKRVETASTRYQSNRLVIMLFVLIALALAIGGSFGVAKALNTPIQNSMDNTTVVPDNEVDEDIDTLTINPSESPAAAPLSLVDLLSGLSSDGGESMIEEGSPQNQAYQWLSASTYLESYSNDRVIQLYALATLYYSTRGDEWINKEGWLDDDDECQWFSRSNNVCDSRGAYVTISLGSNDLSGSLPPEVALLSHLTSIALSGGSNSKLNGTIPSEFTSLTSLTFFSVSNNELEGKLSSIFSNWRNLQYIDVRMNRFTGTFPEKISDQISLVSVDLSVNKLEGSIPNLQALKNLERLILEDNAFSGSLDESLQGLESVRVLGLQRNQFTSMSTTIGTLSSLEILEAYSNEIIGTMPREIGNLLKLHTLTLHNNQLSREIPSEVGLLENIRLIDLSFNTLTGRIPSELGVLASLQNLRLHSNLLTGTLPSELSALNRLTEIRVDDNDLTGSVSTEVCDLFSVILPKFYLDCGGDLPELSCPPGPCCTYCCSESELSSTCQCLYEGTRFDFLCV